MLVVSKGWAEGGNGTQDLAKAVVDVVENKATQFKPLYDWKSPVVEKIETIAKKSMGLMVLILIISKIKSKDVLIV